MKYILTMHRIIYVRRGPLLSSGTPTTYEVRGLPASEGEAWIDSTSLKETIGKFDVFSTACGVNSKGYKTAEDALAALQHECVV
jgi:hypothetical protein